MTLDDLAADCIFEGPDIPAFCDLIAPFPQRFDVTRLRAAKRIVRRPSLGEVEWRVTMPTGQTVVPVRLEP